jgi:hypothetical protein
MQAGAPLAGPVDLVREACTMLAGYMDVLERLVAEPTSAPGGSPGMAPRAAETPEPWNAPAGRALLDGHEGARRLEAALRYAVTGHPGARRGGSPGNTSAALDAIPRLAAGLGRDAEAAAIRILDRWVNAARADPAIDEAQQWRHVRGRACPYCGCLVTLKVLLDAAGRPTGHVECFAVGCADRNGVRPVAAAGTDVHGRPALAWSDGLVETAADVET